MYTRASMWLPGWSLSVNVFSHDKHPEIKDVTRTTILKSLVIGRTWSKEKIVIIMKMKQEK